MTKKIKTDNKKNTREIPVMALRGLSVFPGTTITFDVGRKKSISSLDISMQQDSKIFLVCQRSMSEDDPAPEELYTVGTVCQVKQLMRFAEDRIRVLVEGICKAKLLGVKDTGEYLVADISIINDSPVTNPEKVDALYRQLLDNLDVYQKVHPKASAEAITAILPIEDKEAFTYELSNVLIISSEQKQILLEIDNLEERMETLLFIIAKEIEVLKLEKDITFKVHKHMEKIQRDYFLREQLKVIKEELGESDTDEVNEYRNALNEEFLPEEVLDKAEKEIQHLEKTPPGSAEGQVIRNYLDLILELPWGKYTEENFDVESATKILNRDHYGLEKVKERILEYLAVGKLKNSLKGPILCFLGPPGVGKTSIARSIAEALNRNYVRMSLGGVRDEAEIRGHRKTYVGAMPGRIINAMKQAKSMNPLILMDEIDKLGNDFRGDPSSALLEVLDSEQNSTFRDHYLEVDFDLSNVLFICTANNYETIPGPLLDRMEIIEVPSYTDEEKEQIAIRYLIPKQLEMHGLSPDKITFEDSAVWDIIHYYTSEAGVRGLERELATACRKIAKLILTSRTKKYTVKSKDLIKLLGTRKKISEKAMENDEIGVATGLAWTSVGGVTLSIEVNILPGTGKLDLTGQLGDVMKESAKAAISYIRSRSLFLGIKDDFYENHDIHIHIPEGATPKDGASAGMTMAKAIASALTEKKKKKTVAMTGEITLRGKVLPIGGLREKTLAALRLGIKTVIIPAENKKDMNELAESVKNNMHFVFAENMDEVLKVALVKNLFTMTGHLEPKNLSYVHLENVNENRISMQQHTLQP
jgi:ATP-dependent Lon protease